MCAWVCQSCSRFRQIAAPPTARLNADGCCPRYARGAGLFWMYLSRCIVSFRDTKTTTRVRRKLFIRPDNLRVLVLGFIDLLLLQPAQQFLPPHQQSVSNVERRKSRILRKRQNSDDANDAESGIWYRDIPKTASLASSASLWSHKSSEGVWGTPQKCVCGYPNAMLAKHVPAQSGGGSKRMRIQIHIYSRVNQFRFIQKS